MKRIIGLFNLSSTDFNEFNRQIENNINILQGDNQEVEVQYSTNVFENGQIVYSALILGRK
jgi:hypothetical protein